ncbi:AIR synthase-related protein, partial [Nocardioides sp.]|uniref:AIR synthase-related protein n=1 Tax=Nocardioides sp. TaxID=35761 RepID=UPI0025ED5948
LARDVRLLARLADLGAAVAAKDVSMAGALGSLAMLLEFTRHGVDVDLDRLPVPADTDPLQWLIAFPTYGFWLTAPQDRAADCRRVFEQHGLACAPVGTVNESTHLTVRCGGLQALVMDLATESITGLWAS